MDVDEICHKFHFEQKSVQYNPDLNHTSKLTITITIFDMVNI